MLKTNRMQKRHPLTRKLGLEETFTLDNRDSGRNGYDMVYRSFPGEKVCISGGEIITNWTSAGAGLYVAEGVPHTFRSLYVDGERAVRARTPDVGHYHNVLSWGEDRSVTVRQQDVPAGFGSDPVEFVVKKHWNQSRLRVGTCATNAEEVTVIPREPERSTEWEVLFPRREAGQRFYWENSVTFVDAPREWFLDEPGQRLYYRPGEYENITEADVVAPLVTGLVEIVGASNIVLHDLVFEHSAWTEPSDEGHIGIQSGWFARLGNTRCWMPSALTVSFSTNVCLEQNTVRHTDAGGVALAAGTLECVCTGNLLYDIGGNGFTVYTGDDSLPPVEERCVDDVIRDNYVTECGIDYSGCVGILGSYSFGLRVERNEVCFLPYSGISVGWGWTSDITALGWNVVQSNDVHNVMQIHDDGAGIYTLSRQDGSRVCDNCVHDVIKTAGAEYAAVAAIYLDEQSAGIVVTDNVFHNVSTTVHRHVAGVNVVTGNVVSSEWYTLECGPSVGYADSDEDGLDDFWETRFLGTPQISSDSEGEDFDGDHFSDVAEYVAGTRPNDPGSALRVTSLEGHSASSQVLCWDGVIGRWYGVLSAPAIQGPWEMEQSNILAQTRGLCATVTVEGVSRFYRLTASYP